MGMKTYRSKEIVQAQQITRELFDNEKHEHIVGVVYDPNTETVEIPNRGAGGHGEIGDWIVVSENERTWICTNRMFIKSYEEVS